MRGWRTFARTKIAARRASGHRDRNPGPTTDRCERPNGDGGVRLAVARDRFRGAASTTVAADRSGAAESDGPARSRRRPRPEPPIDDASRRLTGFRVVPLCAALATAPGGSNNTQAGQSAKSRSDRLGTGARSARGIDAPARGRSGSRCRRPRRTAARARGGRRRAGSRRRPGRPMREARTPTPDRPACLGNRLETPRWLGRARRSSRAGAQDPRIHGPRPFDGRSPRLRLRLPRRSPPSRARHPRPRPRPRLRPPHPHGATRDGERTRGET
jgi:hypothetical protein